MRIEHLPTCPEHPSQPPLHDVGCTCDALDRANERIEKLEARLQRLADWKLPTVIATPLRRARADMLAAHIMSIVRKYIPDDGSKARRRAQEDLRDALYTSGGDMISDADRAEAGLAPRNEFGITAEEMQAMELRRREIMLRPFTATLTDQEG